MPWSTVRQISMTLVGVIFDVGVHLFNFSLLFGKGSKFHDVAIGRTMMDLPAYRIMKIRTTVLYCIQRTGGFVSHE